jgi:hypothetical protein
MSASYYADEIATELVSYARSRFRDVGGLRGSTVTKPLLQDEEYQGFIDRLGAREGLAQAAEALAATFAQKVNQYAQAGGVDVAWPNRPDFYLELRDSIRAYGVGDVGTGQLVANSPVTPTPRNDLRLILHPDVF